MRAQKRWFCCTISGTAGSAHIGRGAMSGNAPTGAVGEATISVAVALDCVTEGSEIAMDTVDVRPPR